MNTKRLWCRTCRYHTCQCKPAFPGLLGGTRMVQELPGVTFTAVPQYARTLTMDDLRKNAWDAVLEDLKERDA